METLGTRLKKTASDVAERLGEAAHTAGERLGEMREIQRLNGRLRALKREKDKCKVVMADLLIRMFDQNTFADALLRPEYERIREIDQAIAVVEEERELVVARSAAVKPASDEMVLLPEEVGPAVEAAPVAPEAAPDEAPPRITAEE